MSNKLFSFDLTVSLSYYTYQLYSYNRQNEYVMGFKNEIEWDEGYHLIDGKNEIMHFRVFCNYEKDNCVVPEDHFICEIKNIIAESKVEAYKFVHQRLYKICRTLSIIMNMYNQHKRDFQPRVEVDFDSLLWVRHEYDVNETKKIEILPSGEVVNATYVTCHIETNVFTKGICNINLDKFNDYFNSTDLELNYMLDEFYLALGKEDAHSKFFHLFSIIEFIEKKYVELSEAKALLTKAEVKEIVVHVSDLKIKSDSKIMQRITDALRNSLTQMTDYGRVDKLVNILKNMGINEIICLTEKVAVDKTVVSQIIKLRNCLFHGDFDESRENTGKETQSVIEKLFIICGMIIEWVADNKKL